MDYAIVKLGNKQHRVRDGETLVVDRVAAEEGGAFEPEVLLGSPVIATVVAHERGPKIRIGKYRRRTGYKRHNGYRSATSRIRISLGTAEPPARAKKEAAPKEAAAAKTAAAPGLPQGYEELTVPEIKAATEGWSHDELEAALAYEHANAARKGAISALESALAKEEQDEEAED
jgi:large subunit ribosomal protein L21